MHSMLSIWSVNMDFYNLCWAIPFGGIILSMSFLPLIAPSFWHKHHGKVPFFWVCIYLVSVAYHFGATNVAKAVFEPIVSDYLSFIIQISTLYIVSGGIFIDFTQKSNALFNTLFLFCGSLLAGWIGTTGAATLLIRPLLRANAERSYHSHLIVFFIFMVANIGGVMTPLGDPPLFIGFLKGIDFFWFMKNLYPYWIATTLILCAIFYALDSFLLRKEKPIATTTPAKEIVIKGYNNIILLTIVLAIVISCNFPNTFTIGHESFQYSSIIRNSLLLCVAIISMKITPASIRKQNEFSLEPMKEIALLFMGIFITVDPIIHILHLGHDGPCGCLYNFMEQNNEFIPSRFFWISGLLSSFLDNAPTFLIFFHLASGNAQMLMTTQAHLLTAFSLSTVFMGALTYIGNAPNLMVVSIAQSLKVKAPSFLQYMLWAWGILGPILLIISWCL